MTVKELLEKLVKNKKINDETKISVGNNRYKILVAEKELPQFFKDHKRLLNRFYDEFHIVKFSNKKCLDIILD